MIQTPHFLSGPTFLLINYLTVNFSMMHKCAINQKVAEEERRKRIRNEKMIRARKAGTPPGNRDIPVLLAVPLKLH